MSSTGENRIEEREAQLKQQFDLIGHLKRTSVKTLEKWVKECFGIVPLPAGLIDGENKIKWVNPAFLEKFGYSLDFLIGILYASLIVAENPDDVYWFFRERPETTQLLEIIHANQSTGYWSARKHEIKIPGEKSWTLFCLDYPKETTPEEQVKFIKTLQKNHKKRESAKRKKSIKGLLRKLRGEPKKPLV